MFEYDLGDQMHIEEIEQVGEEDGLEIVFVKLEEFDPGLTRGPDNEVVVLESQ